MRIKVIDCKERLSVNAGLWWYCVGNDQIGQEFSKIQGVIRWKRQSSRVDSAELCPRVWTIGTISSEEIRVYNKSDGNRSAIEEKLRSLRTRTSQKFDFQRMCGFEDIWILDGYHQTLDTICLRRHRI